MMSVALCAILAGRLVTPAHAQGAFKQLSAIAKAMPGLNDTERTRLEQALKLKFHRLEKMPPRTFSSVQGIVNAGLFEMSENTGDEDGPISDADMLRIADVSLAGYHAITNGADPNLAEDLALVGFAREITAGQIEAAAKALSKFLASQIKPDTYQEVISQALDNGWDPEVTRKVSDGLMQGANAGLDAEMLTLVLIIGVAQDLEDRGIDGVVTDGLTYVRTRKDLAYDALQKALRSGLAPPIGREIYYIAMEEGWPEDLTQGAFCSAS
jgi:hypothetical protein